MTLRLIYYDKVKIEIERKAETVLKTVSLAFQKVYKMSLCGGRESFSKRQI